MKQSRNVESVESSKRRIQREIDQILSELNSDTSSRKKKSKPNGFNIFIKCCSGQGIALRITTSSCTVEEIKFMIQDKQGIPTDEQRLIFNGQQLENDQQLSDYNISPESTLHLLDRLRGC